MLYLQTSFQTQVLPSFQGEYSVSTNYMTNYMKPSLDVGF